MMNSGINIMAHFDGNVGIYIRKIKHDIRTDTNNKQTNLPCSSPFGLEKMGRSGKERRTSIFSVKCFAQFSVV